MRFTVENLGMTKVEENEYTIIAKLDEGVYDTNVKKHIIYCKQELTNGTQLYGATVEKYSNMAIFENI